MLQIEEWFRRSLKKKERRPASTAKSAVGMVHNRSQETAKEIGEISKTGQSKEVEPAEIEWIEMFESEEGMETENITELEPQEDSMVQDTAAEIEESEHITEQTEQIEEPGQITEQTEKPEQITEQIEQIGQDVTDMVDMKKEDFLLQQIDEFREKAKQLQELMQNREIKAEELQGVVDEREAKANELDNLIQVRKGEADKIMETVSARIDEMSEGIKNEMSGLSDTLRKEVSDVSQNLTQGLGGVSQNLTQGLDGVSHNLTHGIDGVSQNLTQGIDGLSRNLTQRIDGVSQNLTQEIGDASQNLTQKIDGVSQNLTQEISGVSQNLTQEINQSAEKTRQAVETVTKNAIDQNTHSLEALKEQLGQIDQREQINELSTGINSQVTTLKADIADKVHAENVKCYRNIQVSLDDQSRLLSEGDEKIRQYIQEQMESLNRQVKNQAKFVNASLFFSIINFLGIAGILVVLFLF